MLFTNRNTPSNKKNGNGLEGGSGALVYQSNKVRSKRTRYSDGVEKSIKNSKNNVQYVAKIGNPVSFGLNTDKTPSLTFVKTTNDAITVSSAATVQNTSKTKKTKTVTRRLKSPPTAPTSTNPDDIKSWIESCIKDKVSRVTNNQEVIELINTQLETKIPKGLSVQDVEILLRNNMPKHLSLSEIEDLVQSKLSKFISLEDVQKEIEQKILNQKIPKSITLEDVQKEIDQKVISKIPKLEDVQKEIDQKILNQKIPKLEDIQKEIDQKIPKSITLEDVQKEIDQKVEHNIIPKIPSIPTIPKMEDIQKEIDQKILNQKIPKSITLEDVQKEIDQKVFPKIPKMEEVQKEIQSCLNTLADPKQIVESYVKLKLKELPTQETIGKIVENYLESKIREKEDIVEAKKKENPDEDDEDEDEEKTYFEELIEPAVARIVQRILKYDYSGKEYLSTDHPHEQDEKSFNIDIQYDEVYDYKQQERGQFEAPVVEYKMEKLPTMKNPLHQRRVSELGMEQYKQPTEDVSVDLSTVYQKEEVVQYENELRSEFRSSRKWVRLGNGIDKGSVLDLTMDKTRRKVYIVGSFKHVNKVAMENIAVYDINIRGWHHVGNGVSGLVTSITIYEKSQILFIGGLFSKVGKGENQVQAQNIAAYYIQQNRWVNLGEGLNRECTTLYFDEAEEKLYAGGSFTQSGSQPLHYVGIYDLATNTWKPLNNGELNGPCRSLLKVENGLYLGGLFTHAGMGHSEIYVSYLAHYNLETSSWSSLSGGLQGYCNTIAYDPTEKALYVGGTFTSVGEREKAEDAHHVAKYYLEHQRWDTMVQGVNNVVHSLCFDTTNNCLYVGGNFTSTHDGNIVVNRIVRYDPYNQKWIPLENHFPRCKVSIEDEGNNNVGLNGVCKVLNIDKKSLFIAGSFQIAGNITANSIVRYVLQR